jgi:hypothetical protein
MGDVIMKSSPALANITDPTTTADRDKIVALEARNTILEAELARVQEYLAAIEPALVKLAQHVDAAPPPRVGIQPGWLSPKQAAHVAGVSLDTIYRKRRRGLIQGVKNRVLAINPATLPAKKIRK